MLLADESVTIQKVVNLVLSEEGHEIKSVASGDEALSVIPSYQPDIILADIKLKGKNGYQVAQQVKGSPATSRIPVLLLAGAFEPVDEELLKESGANGSITKPFESKDLIAKIQSLLGGPEGAGAAEATVPPAEEEPVFDLAEEAEASTTAEVSASGEEDLWEIAGVGEDSGVVEAEVLEAEVVEEPMQAPPAQQAAAQMPRTAPQAPEVPGAEELVGVFREAVREKLAQLTNGLDVRKLLLEALVPDVKETVEKILWQVTPELAEKLLRDAVQESMGSLNKELENIIWETVPELAETIIRREIEKIKAES